MTNPFPAPIVWQSPGGESPLHRFFKHFDWILFADILLLSLIGLVMVYSASLRFGNPEIFVGKQGSAFLIGFFLLFIFATLNYQVYLQHPGFLFAVSVSLLVLVLLAGTAYHGTKAWFTIGMFSFQPSEISKLIAILLVAAWCDRNAKELRQGRALLVPFLIVLCHIGLILLQPDFGSTLVYFPVLLGILFVAGAHFLHLFVILFYGLVAGGVLLLNTALSLAPLLLEGHPFWRYLYNGTRIGKEMVMIQIGIAAAVFSSWWLCKQLRFRLPKVYFAGTFLLILAGWTSSSVFLNSLKEYQRKRLNVFFSPGLDPMGAGYHVIQSVVALGSGKVLGKGLFSGTQGRLGFLPEQHTDFIFSVLGEELGFLASGLVLLLYLVLIWRAFMIAGDARDRFGSLTAVGIGVMFAFYIFVNLGMVMGLAPVTGLPLPFLSYGGSALISSLVAVGILLSIHVRRYAY